MLSFGQSIDWGNRLVDRGDFVRQAGERVRQGACDLVLNAANWLYILQGFGRAPDAPAWGLLQSLHHQFCDEPLEGAGIPVGWRGGACPVLYDVYVEWYLFRADGVNNPQNFRNAQVRVLGPIERIGWFQEPDPNGIYEGWVALVQGQPQPSLPDGTVRFAGASTDFFLEPYFSTIEVRRVDGGPDNCGPLPPTIPRPPDVDFEVPLVWIGPNNVEFSVIANAAIGFAYLDADLNVVLPFRLSIPIDISPTIKIPFEFNLFFNFGDQSWTYKPPFPPGSEPSRPPRQPRPPQPPPPRPPLPPGGEAPPSVDPGAPPPVDLQAPQRRIVAALVRATFISPTATPTEIFQQVAPSIRAPNLGYCSFQIRLESGESCWTEDLPIKNANQLVTCPWPGGAISVAATPRTGVDLVVIPLYAESEEFLDLFDRRAS